MSNTIPSGTLTLSKEELFLINLIREKKFQELTVKVQDGVIVLIERKEKFRSKKGGPVAF